MRNRETRFLCLRHQGSKLSDENLEADGEYLRGGLGYRLQRQQTPGVLDEQIAEFPARVAAVDCQHSIKFANCCSEAARSRFSSISG